MVETTGNFKKRTSLLSLEGTGKEKMSLSPIPVPLPHLPMESPGLGTHFSSSVRAVTGFTRRYLQLG